MIKGTFPLSKGETYSITSFLLRDVKVALHQLLLVAAIFFQVKLESLSLSYSFNVNTPLGFIHIRIKAKAKATSLPDEFIENPI